jgi:hydrogenase maturation factor
VDLKKIPIRQETVEICEFFGLNPYMLKSGGALLLSSDDGEGLKNELSAKGINAEIIGYLVEGNDRLIINDEDESFLQLPQSDEILKILG